MASIERNPAALSLFKRIVRELKQSNKHFSPQHPLYKNMFNQLRIHQTTQKIGLKASNEVHHTADVFATYLQSRRQLSELHQKYCKGERTIDQAARMVGLELPQRWEEHKHSNNGTGQ